AVLQDREVRVRMDVDEARRDDQALGVNLALALARHLAEGGDLVALDGEVAVIPRIAGAVDELAVADDQVIGGVWLRRRRECQGGEEEEDRKDAEEGAAHGLPFQKRRGIRFTKLV